MKIKVQCYAGYRGEQEPRSFVLGERSIPIMEIIDRWFSPDGRYFKVQAYDGTVYILHHLEASGEWDMTLFSRQP